MVWTGEPPLNGMDVQVIRRGATDGTVALVQRVLYAYLMCDIGLSPSICHIGYTPALYSRSLSQGVIHYNS